MKILNKIKTSLRNLNSVSGIIAVCIALLGYLIAYLLYPAQKYHIGYFGSELGVGPGGVYFSLGLIFSGYFFLKFISYLKKVINIGKVNIKRENWIFISAKISVIAYSLLGVFPGISDNPVIFMIHGILVFMCYSFGFFFIFFLSAFFSQSPKFLKFHAYIGYFIAFGILTFLFSWISVIQWIFTLTYFVWIAYIAGYMLYKKM